MSLNLKSVIKRFPGFSLEIDLDVNAGEMMTLLGPSGCGKTTTLRIVAGLERPDSGTIVIGGETVENVPTHRRGVGLVFQDYALFPHMTVSQNVAFGPKMHHWTPERTERRVHELLELIRLSHISERRVEKLSGGEQQRVALARALAPEPRILLLDEPLSALDTKLRQSLRRQLRDIQKQLAVTTIYVTHDQEEALSLSDRIVVMNRGVIAQIGTPREIFTQPRDVFVADFMGRSNRIPGRIVGTSGPWKQVESALGPLLVGAPQEATGAVVVSFRPGGCLVGGATTETNTINGQVTDTEYLGDTTVVRLECAAVTLSIEMDTAPSPGDRISFTIPPESCWAIETMEGGKG